jgi:hypothetical protein
MAAVAQQFGQRAVRSPWKRKSRCRRQ